MLSERNEEFLQTNYKNEKERNFARKFFELCIIENTHTLDENNVWKREIWPFLEFKKEYVHHVCECGEIIEVIRIKDNLPSFRYITYKQCSRCRDKHFKDGWEEREKSINNAFVKGYNPLVDTDIDWKEIEKAWLKKKKEEILCYPKKIKDTILSYLMLSKN